MNTEPRTDISLAHAFLSRFGHYPLFRVEGPRQRAHSPVNADVCARSYGATASARECCAGARLPSRTVIMARHRCSSGSFARILKASYLISFSHIGFAHSLPLTQLDCLSKSSSQYCSAKLFHIVRAGSWAACLGNAPRIKRRFGTLRDRAAPGQSKRRSGRSQGEFAPFGRW